MKWRLNNFLVLFALLFLLTTSSQISASLGQEDEKLSPSHPLAKAKEALLAVKTDGTVVHRQVKEGWYDARLITLSTQFYIKTDEGFVLYQDASEPLTTQLYKDSPQLSDQASKSHELLKLGSLSWGVSVDTSIHTQVRRNQEKKQTFIQYDKVVIQDKKDFPVNITNEKDQVNYDGGHLADHKFSAQGSHTDPSNYIPQIGSYNRWLKEPLVKNAKGYLEIPLYTSNPPSIKVKGDQRYNAIPIGIILIPLSSKDLSEEAYYFPNNQFHYQVLKQKLGHRSVGKKMLPNFKLKRSLSKLLWPAIIHDLQKKHKNLARQLHQEKGRSDIMATLIGGMSQLTVDAEEDVLIKLASEVFHQSNITIGNVLEIDRDLNKGQPNPQALRHSFNVLGHFLIEYALKNTLKSEVLSTHSRIMFADIMTDFIECHDQVSELAFKRVEEVWSKDYQRTIEELWDIKDRMNLTDVIYFANLYKKLSAPFIEPAFYMGFDLGGDMNLEDNFFRFITLLKVVYRKTENVELEPQVKQNLVDLFSEAQEDLSYMIEKGYPQEYLSEQKEFLKTVKQRVEAWNNSSNSFGGSYQTSPNSEIMFRCVEGYKARQIAYLGTASSSQFVHPEEEDSTEEDSGEENEGSKDISEDE